METYRLIRNADWIVTMDEHRSRYRHARGRGAALGRELARPLPV